MAYLDHLAIRKAYEGVVTEIHDATGAFDKDGKVGLRVRSVDKGVFVALVTKGSPSAMGGLRFGDQILQINGKLK